MAIIALRDITKVYSTGDVAVPVLNSITLDIHEASYVALMGSSGSGKSTLMNILGCLDRPTSGSYQLAGNEIATMSADERAVIRSQRIGFIFQSFNLLRRTTALENVMMPLTYAQDVVSDQEARERATKLLQKVGLANRLDHEPSQLSGGQQQRVAIARALINRPSILLADEPTGNLDSKTTDEVLEMFRDLNKNERLTILIVTHETNVADQADQIIRMHDGRIVPVPSDAKKSMVPNETGTE